MTVSVAAGRDYCMVWYRPAPRVCHAGREIPEQVTLDGPMSGSMAMAGSVASRMVACEDNKVACRMWCGMYHSPHRTF